MLRNKRNALLVTWIMSYLLVIVIAVSISGGILAYSLGAQKKELVQNTQTMFEMVQSRTDTMFEMVQNITLSFENNPSVQAYLEEREPSVSQAYEVIRFIANTSVSTLSYNMIGGIYLYVPEGDYVLNDLGKYPSLDFYKTYHQSADFPYQQWKEVMDSGHTREYQNLVYRMGGQNSAPGICLLQTLGTGNGKATLAVVLNSGMIAELLDNTWPTAAVGMGIYDSSGKQVFCYGDDTVKPILSVDSEEAVKRNGFQMYTVKSTITMFQYRFLYPESAFHGLYIKVALIFGLMLLALGLLAVLATSHYAKKNYRSLQRIARLIEKNVKTKIEMDDQVYAYMEEELQNSFDRHRDLKEELEEQDQQMKKIFVTNLLTRRRVNHDVIEEYLKKYNIRLLSDAFYVAIFYVVDIEDIFFEKNKGSTDDQMHLANFIIENIAGELLSETFVILSGEVEDTFTAVVGLPAGANANAKAEMVRAFQKSIEVISREFGFSFKICVSNLEHGLVNAHTAYKNAAYVLDYSLTIASGEIVFYDEMEETVTYSSADLISIQEKYTGLVQSGNYSDAINVLEPVFQELEVGNMSLEMLKCKMYALENLIVENVRISAKVNRAVGTDYAEEQAALLAGCKTLPDLHDAHTRVLTALHERTNLKGADKNVHLIEQAQQYIHDHYADCNMSVSGIADQFQMNALYFSRLFTKYTGTYISDYISRVRLEKVKELLLQTNDTIAAIAGQTGFYSDVVLIRSFKKNVGTTPGKYRAQHKDE